MEPFSLVVGFGLAIGVGMVANTIVSVFYETGRRLFGPGKRSRLNALGIRNNEKNQEQQKEEALLGLENISWNTYYAVSTLIGLALLAFLGPTMPGIRLGFLGLPILVWLARGFLVQQRKRFMAGQVRQFLIDVRLHLSLQGSLLLGLENIGRTTLETSPVYRQLQIRLKGSSARSGLDLLNQLTDDLASPQLLRAVQRIQAAQQSGGISNVDQAIASVISELNEEIGYQAEEEMQRLPLRITLLAMPFLLGPIVILLFYPLIDRILNTLSGVSIGGGF